MPQPAIISVTAPVSQGIDRVKRLLFRPFDLGKWFTIGFCAWLARLGQAGLGGSFNFGSHQNTGNWREQLERACVFVQSNLAWIVPLAILLVGIGVTVGVVLLWVSSRGKFMFLHCVALEKAEIDVPWRRYAWEGRGLFLFRLVLALIGAVPSLALVVVVVVIIAKMVNRGGSDLHSVVALVGVGAALLAVGTLFFIVRKLTVDFVVPIMFLRGCTCREGWREFLGLLSANFGDFVVYLLFQIALGIATGALVLIVVLATCCLAGCLMIIPYLGTVVLLPLLIFQRSYSLHYFAQFGQLYDVFPQAPPSLRRL
jgi:hypothetical protein